MLSSFLAFGLKNALQIFDFILMFGAGTGLIFILRWFWWRINAWSEISAIFTSGIVSIIFSVDYISSFLFGESGLMPEYFRFPLVVLITTLVWLLVTFLTSPEPRELLLKFCEKINAGGPGWKCIVENKIYHNNTWTVPSSIIAILLSIITIYSILFATGYFIYGSFLVAISLVIISLVCIKMLIRIWKNII